MRRRLGRDAAFIAAVAVLFGTFEYLICAMVGSIDVEGTFAEITRRAPPMLRELIERNMPGASAAVVLSFGWNHPVAHALLTAVAIALGARAIAGEIESGAIELVMAQPLSRSSYFLAHVLWAVAAIAVAISAGVVGTMIGQRAFHLEPFGAARMSALLANAMLLQLAIYGLTLLASSFARETGRAAMVGVLAAVTSFLVNAVAVLWNPASFAKPYSLHHYYDPRAILVDGQWPGASLAALAGVALVGLLAAWVRFQRRDLP